MPYKQIQVTFDTNEPFSSIAQSVNSALPGMPVEPAGWANTSIKAYGMDKMGNVYSWSLADVSPTGVVTLHQETGSIGIVMASVLQDGDPTQFPQPTAAPVAQQAPAESVMSTDPPALSIVKGAAPAVK